MATTLIEVCTRKGDTKRALSTYQLMRDASSGSNMAPSVHAYTAAMRAAAEGGAWETALEIWADMEACGCKPTGTCFLQSVHDMNRDVGCRARYNSWALLSTGEVSMACQCVHTILRADCLVAV